MNTPHRDHQKPNEPWNNSHWQYLRLRRSELARWTRKNRIRQLKHTIAILTARLKDTEQALEWTQKFTKCYIVRPSHWHPQGLDGKQYTRKQWLQEMKARQSKSPQP